MAAQDTLPLLPFDCPPVTIMVTGGQWNGNGTVINTTKKR